MAVVSHYDVAPVIDIFGSVSGRDLGGVAGDMNKLIDAARSRLPRGSRVVVRGQVQTMRASYIGLLSGLALCHPARLPADRGEFSILARPLDYDFRVAGGIGRNCVVPVRHPHYVERACTHGNDHVYGRCHRK